MRTFAGNHAAESVAERSIDFDHSILVAPAVLVARAVKVHLLLVCTFLRLVVSPAANNLDKRGINGGIGRRTRTQQQNP